MARKRKAKADSDSDNIDQESASESLEEDSGSAYDEEPGESASAEEDGDAGLATDSEDAVTPAVDSDASEEAVKPKKASKKASSAKSSKGDTPSSKPKSVKKKVTMGRESDSSVSDEEETPKKKYGVQKVKPKQAAPTEHVAAGLIGKHMLQFLGKLTKEEFQDRDWFAEHDAWYRKCWAEWNAFVTEIQPVLQEADDTLPILPSRDLVHRIYRDVRFSSDKRPYKTNLSASFSRGGRKGLFAGYYLQVAANGKSLLAGGRWQVEKNDLATIRHSIQSDPSRLRDVIEADEFVEMFGEARPNRPQPSPKSKARKKQKKTDSDNEEDEASDSKKKKKQDDKVPAYGVRQNIFGHEDELINAPKGIAKDHPEIDLLRLRTFAVVKYFTDAQVTSKDFKQTVKEVATVMAPLVNVLNELTLPTPREGSDSD